MWPFGIAIIIVRDILYSLNVALCHRHHRPSLHPHPSNIIVVTIIFKCDVLLSSSSSSSSSSLGHWRGRQAKIQFRISALLVSVLNGHTNTLQQIGWIHTLFGHETILAKRYIDKYYMLLLYVLKHISTKESTLAITFLRHKQILYGFGASHFTLNCTKSGSAHFFKTILNKYYCAQAHIF